MLSLSDLKRAVVLKPDDAQARYALAEALFAEGQYAGAVTQLEKAVVLAPDDNNIRRLLSRTFEKDGKVPRAMAVLEEMVKRAPHDADARDELCGFLLQQGRIDDAILHAAEAVRFSPEDVKRRVMLADLLVQRRLPERARAILEEAQRLFPTDPQVAKELKNLYVELGDEVASEKVAGERDRAYFQKQAKSTLSSARVSALLTSAPLKRLAEELAKGDLPGAHRALGAVSEGERAQAGFHFLLGELRLLERSFDAAEAAFTRALEAKPDLGVAWNRLGDLAQGKNDLKGAVTLYKKAILFGEDDANAWEDLGDIHATLGEKDKAQKMYRTAAQKEPGGSAAKKLESLAAPQKLESTPAVGKVGVLGWSPTGGAVSPLEAVAVDGKGELIFSGNVGPTGKEAASVAFSVIKARSRDLGVDGLVRTFDLHLHFTDTAIGKDGPSAGLALLLAGVSAFTQKPLKPALAATGELTLHGVVMAVGGIHEKLVAAHLAGVKTVLLPKQNLKDARALPDEVTRGLELIFVESVAEAITKALAGDAP
ncbi:MAG: tetratricopeptide repeat protein [Myxococcales bacterium]|nr:tetratricopeptide repeat protein [Myxococcales bacterium]